MKLGTILPDAKQLAANDRHQESMARKRDAAAVAAHPELRRCERRLVGGEIRYYDTADQYAIVSRQGRVIWFAVGPDGDLRLA